MNIGTQHKTSHNHLSTYKYSSHRDSRNCLIWLGVRLQTKAPCLSERPSVFTSVSAFCTPYHGKKHVLWLEMNSNTLCMRMSPVIYVPMLLTWMQSRTLYSQCTKILTLPSQHHFHHASGSERLAPQIQCNRVAAPELGQTLASEPQNYPR